MLYFKIQTIMLDAFRTVLTILKEQPAKIKYSLSLAL